MWIFEKKKTYPCSVVLISLHHHLELFIDLGVFGLRPRSEIVLAGVGLRTLWRHGTLMLLLVERLQVSADRFTWPHRPRALNLHMHVSMHRHTSYPNQLLRFLRWDHKYYRQASTLPLINIIGTRAMKKSSPCHLKKSESTALQSGLVYFIIFPSNYYFFFLNCYPLISNSILSILI